MLDQYYILSHFYCNHIVNQNHYDEGPTLCTSKLRYHDKSVCKFESEVFLCIIIFKNNQKHFFKYVMQA